MSARPSHKKQMQALHNLAHTFYALKDVVRLEMLSVLAGRECTVNELAATLDKSQPLMSWHLRRLKAAGIVKIRRSGREVYCSLDRDVLQQQHEKFQELIGLK
ncbi:HTH-type transcriptional regulator KmtR [Thermoflexales bacterium]|nr:HTH-type transcriptional regulator KmtR [Thermoflexales bacterium]